MDLEKVTRTTCPFATCGCGMCDFAERLDSLWNVVGDTPLLQTRTLESLVRSKDGAVQAQSGETALFIRPGHEFKVVSGLVTNFHLPRSSLLMLVSALAGREHVLDAYREAIEQRYRFYSYGDAMVVL